MIRIAFLAALLALGVSMPFEAGAASKAEMSQVFQAQEMYTAEGTIQKAEADELRVTRQNLPPLEMDMVSQQTQITLDGQTAQASDLQEGMDVRAQFQIAGDDIIATKIDAKSSPGTMQPGMQQPGMQPQP